MKTAAIWTVAALLGFGGGVLGQRLSARIAEPPPLAGVFHSIQANEVRLVDRSGKLLSVWGSDYLGRPFLVLNDRKIEGRIIIGPIDSSDFIDSKAKPDPNQPWGLQVTAPDRALAFVGSTMPRGATSSTGFILLTGGDKSWSRDAHTDH